MSGSFVFWRRGRDSNSWRGRPLDGFQDRCIKPLCHLSIPTLLIRFGRKPNKTSFYRRFWLNSQILWNFLARLSSLALRFQDRCIKPLCHLFVLVEFMLLRNINLYWIALANTSCLFTYLFDDVKHYLENCNILSVYGCALAVVSFK